MNRDNKYCIYLLECADGTYYCGITTDMGTRLKQHNAGKAAKYTRGRSPVNILVKTENCYTKNMALKIEHSIKKLPKHRKVAAIIAET